MSEEAVEVYVTVVEFWRKSIFGDFQVFVVSKENAACCNNWFYPFLKHFFYWVPGKCTKST